MSHLPLTRRGFLYGASALIALGAPLAADGTQAAAATLPHPRLAADAVPLDGWMSFLPDTASLTSLSIPGTHDSLARYGGAMVACQQYGVAEQLERGVRFLDVRCRAIDGVFTIHHGFVYQEINFGKVLQHCRDFLRQHPRETILMRLQQEYSSASADEFKRIFDAEYLSAASDILCIAETVPTLGQARGKVILLSGMPYVGGIWFNSDNPDLVLEDEYSIPTLFHRGRKWDTIVAALEKAREAPHNRRLHISFTSGWGIGCCPFLAAGYMNPALVEWLRTQPGSTPRRLGVIPIDWIGCYEKDLVSLIVQQNFAP